MTRRKPEAAVREATEESGLEVRLLAGPSPALPLGYPHQRVAAPWWITEIMVPADNHLDEPHITVPGHALVEHRATGDALNVLHTVLTWETT